MKTLCNFKKILISLHYPFTQIHTRYINFYQNFMSIWQKWARSSILNGWILTVQNVLVYLWWPSVQGHCQSYRTDGSSIWSQGRGPESTRCPACPDSSSGASCCHSHSLSVQTHLCRSALSRKNTAQKEKKLYTLLCMV